MLGGAPLGALYLGAEEPHGLPPPLPAQAQAKLYARSKIARSNATRSNYIRPNVTVLLTKYRYPNPPVTVDVTSWTRAGTLSVSQAVNDEPDTCAMTLQPELPAAHIPQVGDLISVGLATEGTPTSTPPLRIAGGLEFSGPVVVVQHDRRPNNGSPWLSLQCADWQYWFDAQLVNAQWPAQPAATTIADLLARFVNFSQVVTDPTLMLTFTSEFVSLGLPTCAAFVATNWRPSDVIRHLVTELKGGWYIDALRRLHVWASNANEPQQSNPVDLTNYLQSLKSFRHRYDATQVRRRVIVEGYTSQIAVDVPTLTSAAEYTGGIPMQGSVRPFMGGFYKARIGAQWATQGVTHTPTAASTNPPSGHVTQDFAVGAAILYLDTFFAGLSNTVPGWIKVAEQFIRYESVSFVGGALGYQYNLSATIPFGKPVAPIKTGEVATMVDWIDSWKVDAHASPAGSLMPLQSTIVGSDVALIADAIDPDANQPFAPHLPPIEALVQDRRYAYDGANNRAAADLAFF